MVPVMGRVVVQAQERALARRMERAMVPERGRTVVPEGRSRTVEGKVASIALWGERKREHAWEEVLVLERGEVIVLWQGFVTFSSDLRTHSGQCQGKIPPSFWTSKTPLSHMETVEFPPRRTSVIGLPDSPGGDMRRSPVVCHGRRRKGYPPEVCKRPCVENPWRESLYCHNALIPWGETRTACTTPLLHGIRHCPHATRQGTAGGGP